MTDISPALAAWLTAHHQAVLVTLRKDGSPQSSNIAYAFDGIAAHVSVTADRAKTHNLRRDPRGVLHVLGDTFGQYAALSVRAQLGELSTTPGDAAGRDLLALYEQISGQPHPDHAEYFAAMVADRRLRLTLTPVSVSAWGVPGS